MSYSVGHLRVNLERLWRAFCLLGNNEVLWTWHLQLIQGIHRQRGKALWRNWWLPLLLKYCNNMLFPSIQEYYFKSETPAVGNLVSLQDLDEGLKFVKSLYVWPWKKRVLVSHITCFSLSFIWKHNVPGWLFGNAWDWDLVSYIHLQPLKRGSPGRVARKELLLWH